MATVQINPKLARGAAPTAMRHRPRGLLALVAVLAAVAGLTGCGLAGAHGARDIRVTVTENFGTVPVGSVRDSSVAGGETLLAILARHFHVATGPGSSVRSIGRAASGGRRTWFVYVNGVAGALGPALTKVHAGDRIWWDLHDRRASAAVPAVVGAFPDPFVHGIAGKRYPTTLECATGVAAACRAVSAALGRIGVPAATQFFGTGSGTDSLNVLVAPWTQLRATLVASLIEHGPSTSGIYARFGADGRTLELLNPSGAVARTLGAGAGLVAASADISGTPTWIVTGTDAAGVRAAAAAMTPGRLHDRFAVAIASVGDAVPLPVAPGR